MKTTNEIEKDWYEYLRANPHEVIDMLAALLAVSGIERIPDEQEDSAPEGNQVSEQNATEEGKHGGGDA